MNNNNLENNENKENQEVLPNYNQNVPTDVPEPVSNPTFIPNVVTESVKPEVIPNIVSQNPASVTPLTDANVQAHMQQNPVPEQVYQMNNNQNIASELNSNPTLPQTDSNVVTNTIPSNNVTNTIPSQESQTMSNDFIGSPKPKKSKLPVLIFVLILLVLILSGVGGLYIYNSNYKVIVGNSIKTIENFKSYLSLPYKLDASKEYSETGTFTANISSTDATTEAYGNLLSKYTFDYNYSKTADSTLLELNANEGAKLLAGIKLYGNSKSAYVYLNKIFDKYIEVSDLKDALSSANYNSLDDYEYLYNFVKDSLIKNVSKDDFVKSKAKIELNGKEQNVNSLKLEYNEKEILQLFGKVITDIKADKKANEIVTNFYSDFAKYDINTAIKKLDTKHLNVYTYTVYTNQITSKVEGTDFNVKYYSSSTNYDGCYSTTTDTDTDTDTSTDTTSSASKMSNVLSNAVKATKLADEDTSDTTDSSDDQTYSSDSSDDTYSSDDTTDDNDNYFTTSAAEDSDTSSCAKTEYKTENFSVKYRNDTNPRIYVNVDGEEGYFEFVKADDSLVINIYDSKDKKLGYVKIRSNSNLFEVTADIKEDDTEFKYSQNTNIKEVTKGKEYNLDSIISYDSYVSGKKTDSATLNINSTVKNSAKIAEDVSSSIKYEKLTTEDEENIYTNIIAILSGEETSSK